MESSDGKPLAVIVARCTHPAISVSISATETNRVILSLKPGVDPKPLLTEVEIETGTGLNSRVTVTVVLPHAMNASK